MTKESSLKSDPDENEQIDLFEEDNSDVVIDDYKDLDLDFLKSTRRRFLTWNDF
jgi:hypothetical protein